MRGVQSCTLVPIWRLHYISIPFMALSAFVLVDTILVAARPAADKERELHR